MGNLRVFENIVENKLMNLHTAYLAKIVSVKGATAKIQPLGNVKAYGQKAKKQAPLSAVPIIQSARNKVTQKTISTGDNVAVLTPIKAGDIVIVVCCERNITDARKGINSTPVVGHHSMSDSVIVGIL
jgi:hypothetical protein